MSGMKQVFLLVSSGSSSSVKEGEIDVEVGPGFKCKSGSLVLVSRSSSLEDG